MPGPPNASLLESWITQHSGRIADTLGALVSIDTSTPHEDRAVRFVTEYLEDNGFAVFEEVIPATIVDHRCYTRHPLSLTNCDRRPNLRARYDVTVTGRTNTLFNAHIDVVPHESFQKATIMADRVIGHGSADTKNNLVMLVETVRFLRENQVPLRRNVALDVVIEEEIGGNGTLGTIINGVSADEVVVLEPTNLEVFSGHRGCITFDIEIRAASGHMGDPAANSSAIDIAYEVMRHLRQIETVLIAEARQHPKFSRWERPVQVNVGRISGGEWPGSIPARCRVQGNMGFVPPYTAKAASERLSSALRDLDLTLDGDIHSVEFSGLLTEAYICEERSPLFQDLLGAVAAAGLSQKETCAWCVSCDARLYDNMLRVPTAIWGSGKLSEAHSETETILLKDLWKGMSVLASFLSEYQRH